MWCKVRCKASRRQQDVFEGIALKTTLCIGLLCALLAFSGQSSAQNTNTNDLGWPEVPEISDPPAQDPGLSRRNRNGQGSVLKSWPGTDRPIAAPAAVPEPAQSADGAETRSTDTPPAARSGRSVSRSRPPNPSPAVSIPARS